MIWPWSRIAELEDALRIQTRALNDIREMGEQIRAGFNAEQARRIGAEALAAERKEECQRLREDLVASRTAEKEARELMAKTLVEANVRLTTPLVEKLPDFTKMREMAPLQDQPDLARNRRQFETRIMSDVLRKFNYPGFGPRPAPAPTVAEENPPGEGERPSLNAVG